MLLRPHQRGVVDGLAGELAIEFGEGLLAGGIHEQAADVIQEIIARGASHRPGIAKALTRFEDVLDHDPGRRGLEVESTELSGELDAAEILDVAADCGTPAYSAVRGLDGTDFALIHGGRDRCPVAADWRDRMSAIIIIRMVWLFIQ
jgi:hypothetical protein